MPLSAAEVALKLPVPIATVTLTPASEPVSPDIANPAAFSSMLIVLSVATASRFSTSVPTACTVTVNVALAPL